MDNVELEVLYDYLKQQNSYLNDIAEYSFDILSASTDIKESSRYIKEAMSKTPSGDVDVKSILQGIFSTESTGGTGTAIGAFTETDIAKLSSIISIYTESIGKAGSTLGKDTSILTESIKAVNIGFLSSFNKKLLDESKNNVDRFFKTLKHFVNALNHFRVRKDISKNALKSIERVKITINSINDIISSVDLKGIQEFSGSLVKITESIIGFVGGLAVSGILAIPATAGVLFFKFALKLLKPELDYLSKNSAKMKDGSKSLMFIGAGLAAMTLAIGASAYILTKFSITDMVVGILTVVGITYIVSKFYKYMGLSNKADLKNGIKNIALMSLSLLMMTGTFYLMSKIPIEYGKVGMVLLLLAGTALFYTLMGINVVSQNIKKGAISVALMSLSLLLFGWSLSTVSKMLAKQDKAIWQIPLMLLTVTAPFILAGMMMTTILQGVLAIALIGIALWIMKKPLIELAITLGKHGDAVWKIPTIITALGLVFAGAGFLLPFIASGALAIGLVGGALWALSKGLSPIAKLDIDANKTQAFADNLKILVKGLDEAFSELSLSSMIKIATTGGLMASTIGKFASALSNWKSKTSDWKPEDAQILSDTILGVTTAIALGTSPEYISKKHGVEVSQWQILKGIAFTMGLGSNLAQLAKGVMAWKNMKLTAEEAVLISDNISAILSVIPATIAKIGNDDTAKPATGILGFISGGLWTKTDTERGIDYVEGIGNSMKKLAEGVKLWKNMKLTAEDAKLISNNINTILSVLPATIARIGNDDTDKPSMWGLWSTTDTERGIDYVEGIGSSVKRLAEGVKLWKDMKLTPANIKMITGNINAVLAIIPETIAKIGNDSVTAKPGLFGLWSTTDTERGIDYVKGIGTPLNELAKAVLVWKTAKLSPTDIKKINQNITDIITALPSVFAQIGRAKDNDKGFWGLFKSDSEKGIQVVNNLISPLKDLGDVVAKFNTEVDIKERGKQIGEGVRQMLIRTALGLSTMTLAKIDVFSKFIDPFKKFTDIYIKFLQAIKKESVDFGGISKLVDSSADFYDKYTTATTKSTPSPSYSPSYTPYSPTTTPTGKPKPAASIDQLLAVFAESSTQQSQQIGMLIKEIQRLNGKINELTSSDGRLKTSMTGN